jgi:hypothetical protein
MGRISCISFVTDMTRANAPLIPLGFVLEATWPEQARWLGLIGRTRLTEPELDKINRATWPELQTPFGLLNKMFEQGWDSAWGEAGTILQNSWVRSSIAIDVDEYPLISEFSAETPEKWAGTCDGLGIVLNGFGAKLVPTIQPPKPPSLLRPKVTVTVIKPAVAPPNGVRTQQELETALAA